MSERGTPWSTSCLTSRLTACASAGLEALRDASYTSLPLQQGQAVKCTGMLVICTDMFLMVLCISQQSAWKRLVSHDVRMPNVTNLVFIPWAVADPLAECNRRGQASACMEHHPRT